MTFKWSVECKSYAQSDSFETMVAGNANIFKWMNESIVDAAKIKKLPLLIFKWNRTKMYVAYIDKQDVEPNLILQQNGMTIYVNYFDELVKEPKFWIEL